MKESFPGQEPPEGCSRRGRTSVGAGADRRQRTALTRPRARPRAARGPLSAGTDLRFPGADLQRPPAAPWLPGGAPRKAARPARISAGSSGFRAVPGCRPGNPPGSGAAGARAGLCGSPCATRRRGPGPAQCRGQRSVWAGQACNSVSVALRYAAAQTAATPYGLRELVAAGGAGGGRTRGLAVLRHKSLCACRSAICADGGVACA